MDWPSGASEDPTHVDLLAMAHAVRRAVVDDDTETMHVLWCQLRADLATHVRSERERLPEHGSLGVMVVDGQRRLLELLDEVMLGMGRDPDCNCLVRAAEVEVALRRQARLEATILDRQPFPDLERT